MSHIHRLDDIFVKYTDRHINELIMLFNEKWCYILMAASLHLILYTLRNMALMNEQKQLKYGYRKLLAELYFSSQYDKTNVV